MESIFKSIDYLDFHTHRMRHKDDDQTMEIVSVHLGKETDVSYFTVGLHPWWTSEKLSKEVVNDLHELLIQPKNLAMGEIGLDKLKGPDLSLQIDILRSQLNIARDLNKPVIIHCVRAFDQLIKVKKEFPEISKWCVHGFGRHVTLAKQLIAQGFYLSLMPSKASKYQEWFESLPHDKLFLETDSMPDVCIKDIYGTVSKITGLTKDVLCWQMINNAIEFFEQ